MLTEELARVFSLVVADYDRFKIEPFMDEVVQVLAARMSNPSHYQGAAKALRERAETLLQNSNYSNFPERIKVFLRDSAYSHGMPDRIAKLILSHLTVDPRHAPSQAEFAEHKQAVLVARSAMHGFLAICEKGLSLSFR
jgi:hypothetical protein